MNIKKEEKIKEILKQGAAEFFSEKSDLSSLTTVTKTEISDRGRKALIGFTVFPEKDEEKILKFAKRNRSNFREFLKERTALIILPFVDFAIDFGEKNRQKLEEISLKIR